MYNIGDVVQLKKAHACGNNIFTFSRTGADYKLVCAKCGHVIMLDKTSAERAVKRTVKETSVRGDL